MASIKYKTGLLFGILLVSLNFASSLWVDSPITCYTCEGAACTSSLGLFKVCAGSDSQSQSCVTVFDADNTVISRGCKAQVDTTHAEYCEANSEKCISCSSNGCNRGKALSDYVECLSCDSETDKNCVLDPNAVTSTRLCYKSCMVALYARNASDPSSVYELTRSCLDDKDMDDRDNCTQGGDEFCKGCDGDKCNVDMLPENRHSCYHCIESDDCADEVNHACASYTPNDQCYFLFEDNKNIVRMGCRSEFDPEAVVAQISEKKLLLCDGVNCNSFGNIPPMTSCNKCDSGSDPKCLDNPVVLEMEVKCNFPYNQCYSKVSDTNAGVTVRGCLSDLSGKEFYECLMNENKNCQSCSGTLCNEPVVPADRMKCQRCNSADNVNCHVQPTALSLCPLYSEDEKCVSTYTKGVTTRGCASEVSCDPSHEKSCRICSGAGCNIDNVKKTSEESYGIFQSLPLSCYTCSGTECADATGEVKVCEGNPQQDCLTVFNSAGEVVSRGCEDSVAAASTCTTDPQLCFNCKSNECNTITDAAAYTECIYCDSANDPDCVQDLGLISVSRKCTKGCLTALYPRADDPNVNELIRTCVEDLEANDVDACGTDSTCVKCQGANCNGLVVPENRISCNFCDGDDCELITPKLCPTFAESDQCFMLFDESQTVVRMGCKSEFSATELRELVKQLILCSGENCNSYDNLPKDNVCAVCDSSSDVLCATNPSTSLSVTQCSALPNKQCFSRVTPDGTTARGCLQTLPVDDFMACLDGTACEVCTGARCNAEVFPADRAICHRCNSLDNGKCESTPSSPSACPLYIEGDTCVSKLVNGVTHRGCGSELSCGDLGRKDCRECSGPSCNAIDLIAADVGVPGLWQETPLTCFTCLGNACSTSTGELSVCEGNELQNCATVFSQAGKVVARGCSDTVDASYAAHCDANPELCFECKSSECNKAVSTSDYIDCVFCDSKTDANCTLNSANVARTRKCHKACMTSLYPRTSDANPSYDLIRTCLDDKDEADHVTCDLDPLCKICAEERCNTDLIPQIRTTCFQCSGDDCQLPTASPCRSYTDNEQCYALFDETNSYIQMGCKSDFDPEDVTAMLLLRKLFLCDGNNCNAVENLPVNNPCRICSSRTDSQCATNATAILSTSTCRRLPITDCYTRILDDGHTERGCLSSLEGDAFLDCYYGESGNCATCASGNCNKETFPEGRLSCHTCNSAVDPSCDTKPQQADICVKYSPDQECVTTLKDDIIYRGCSEQLECDKVCRTCNTTDCNVLNLRRQQDANPGVWQDLPLNCYWCTGDRCTNSNGALNYCAGSDGQYCMTVFGEAGTVVRRGCSDAVEAEYSDYCDDASENCFNCNSNGCNNALSLNNYIDCVYCDSALDENCLLDVASVETTRRCNKQCMTAYRLRGANDTRVYELVRSCLDDKDLDDRELCGSDGSLCSTCASEKCNTDTPVGSHLQCLSCVGDDCESPQSKTCLAYEETNSCFILFDEDNTATRMGCLSEFNDVELTSNLPKLITCSGDNCNNFSIIPQAQACSVCDSADDVRCATDPAAIPNVKTCSNFPRVDCYSRVKPDGRTARGCLSDLTTDLQLSCLTGSANCSICLGNGCNNALFPADRLSCHKCNSLDDPSCQDAPNAPNVCPIYSPSQTCSSSLVDGVTHRGCGDELVCTDTDKQKCKYCSTSNCNRGNLFMHNIGYPGTWQDLPISCFTCTRQECRNESTIELKQCAKNKLQNCVTVFNMMGMAVQRGCTDDLYSGSFDHHCDNHPELCRFCKSSGCNDAESPNDYVDCLFCDSTTDTHCAVNPAGVTRTRKCRQCMTALYQRTEDANATNPTFPLTRSCADDKEADDRTECEAGNDANCKICTEDNCNTDLIPEERLSCYQCEGESCEDPIAAACPIFKENDHCYLLFGNGSDNTIIRMGCASDFSESDLAAKRKKMLLCEGDNCNTFDKVPISRQCLVCDSSVNPLCATRPNDLLTFATCADYPHTRCFTKIEDGLTKRGCLSENTIEQIDTCLESGDSAKCNVCDADHCNIAIYPSNRRTCHRCSSSDDANCQGSPRNPSVCPIYQEDDECVVQIAQETTLRGCTSDFTCDSSDRETCRICPNNNCNSIDLLSAFVGHPGKWQDLPLACYECEGAACQSALGSPTSCQNNNLQNCMTVFDASGEVLKRGCSDDVFATHGDWCDANTSHCPQCKSSGCNNAQALTEFVDCVFCDSNTNQDCVLNPTGAIRTRKCKQSCMAALYPKTAEEDPSFELSRSCLDDKEAEDRDSCTAGNDNNCQSCTGPSCNNFAFPAERHQCLTCKGDECELAKSQDCLAYHPADQCYVLFDNTSTIVAMGCRSELDSAVVTSLVQSKSLLLCDGKNCNSYDNIPQSQSCVVCNSASDPRCATNPNLISTARSCSQLPYTGCFTRINEHGHTERGCQASLPNEQFYSCLTGSDAKCDTCSGSKCNANVFPSNRLRCHRCNSTADDSCAESPDSNMVCPVMLDEEQCVVSYKDGLTTRGCSHELTCDVSNKKLCRVCSGSGCNSQNLQHVAKDGEPGKWQDVPISCYTCEGSTCASSLGSLETCAGNDYQNCMTVFDAAGVVIQRGCSDAVTDAQESWCERNLDKCYRCNSNECNKATSLDDFVECVTCDTAIDGSCIQDPAGQKISRKCYQSCMTALYPFTNEEDPSYATIRSCLDDKEASDRELCASGSDKHCTACTSGNCNVDKIPEDRRSCLHCSGDDCQLPQELSCAGYRPNDQCYMMFDERFTITALGCKSDFTNADAISLIKQKRLLLCDGDNCNHFDAIPASQPCALCNSRTDANCAVSPANLTSATTCRRLPYTQCYSRVLSDGATERGCLSSLDSDEFYDCLTEESGSCKPCVGSGCNKQVFPENRLTCHKCDSGDDADCESNPDSAGICRLYDPEDTCVTSYISGMTTRGCGSSTECDASSRRSCRTCSSHNCNTIDLASLWDDNFGKWQDLPLSCYECEGASCQGNELGEAVTCANNNEQDCSTVFNAAGEVVARGCSDEVEQKHGDFCDENPGHCFNCKSNDCNTATATTDFTECHYCDSNKDKSCVTNPLTATFKTRQCQGGCMVALYQSVDGSNPSYDMMRTCLNDKEASAQDTCTAGKDAFCKACTDDGCNTDNLPDDRLSCYTCFGDECEVPTPTLCPLYKSGDQCFVRFDDTNSIQEMGCLSEYRNQKLEDIIKTKRVYICDGENCNDPNKLPTSKQCAVCDSANDVNCAVDPTLIGSIQTCTALPYTDCYTKITPLGTTQRGCLNDLETNDFVKCVLSGGEECSTCSGHGCNKQIFPESRLRCQSCSSLDDPECESLPTSLQICPLVRSTERCVTAIDGNSTIRGCSSQILCDANDRTTCRRCENHGCNTVDLVNRFDDNNHGLWQALPLRCHSCTGDYCQNSLGPAQACTGGAEQDCVTVFNEDGEVVRRGCQFDVEDDHDLYCRANPDSCLVCKSNECNDAWALSDYTECIACNSESDSTCASNPTKEDFPTRKCQKGCMAATYTSANGTTQIIRTCLDDKELQQQYFCRLDEPGITCSSCSGANCNNFNYPKDRKSCHVCDGTGCDQLKVEYCAAYDAGDTCFAKYENGAVHLAGCSSSVDDPIMQAWKEQNQVYSCSADVCNAPSELPPSYNCVHCDSVSNKDCATDPSAVTTLVHCAAPVNGCFSNITSSVTHRGCLQSLTLPQQNSCSPDSSVLCETCVGEKCNADVYPSDRRRCLICSSESDENCMIEPSAIAVSICPAYATNNMCVVKLENSVLQRGCSSELQCDTTDSERCRVCEKDGCNVDLLDDGAHTLIANKFLLALLVGIITFIGVNRN